MARTHKSRATRRSHRSFVSYIDKSREYYGAHGYPQPYQWAYNQQVGFTPLAKPLSESRLGLVTTSFFEAGKEPAGVPAARPKQPYAASCDDAVEGLFNDDLFWDKNSTNTDDPGTYLPIGVLRKFVADGRLGSVSERFYGVPTDYSQRRTQRNDAPKIEQWMRDDGVDIALLIPL